MKIFNSLGSNYNSLYLFRGFVNIFNKSKKDKLDTILKEKYGGEVTYFYKGREAIEAALKLLSFPKGDFVAINGLTCYVVQKAVTNAGLTCEYIDINESLNYSAGELEKSLHKNSKIRAIIIQNTLGNPIDILKIKSICKSKNLILIEDLAHSVGTKYLDGSEAGTVGDFVALSFSQDKIIDSVSGGALIVRNLKYSDRLHNLNLNNVPISSVIKDMLYPKFTYLIRKFYFCGIGKILHYILKKVKLLSTPINLSENILYRLPKWYINMAFYYIKNLTENLNHRKKIAKIYAIGLNSKITFNEINKNIESSTNIRFPIFVNNRLELVDFLETKGFYISDIWYDSPVAPIKYKKLSDYKEGKCPNAEKISEMILNLPTHINISGENAKYLVNYINSWINTQ